MVFYIDFYIIIRINRVEIYFYTHLRPCSQYSVKNCLIVSHQFQSGQNYPGARLSRYKHTNIPGEYCWFYFLQETLSQISWSGVTTPWQKSVKNIGFSRLVSVVSNLHLIHRSTTSAYLDGSRWSSPPTRRLAIENLVSPYAAPFSSRSSHC